MKLKYERFEGLGCFSVREQVSAADLRVLMIGLETLVKDLEETLLVNASQAKIAKSEALALNEEKIKLNKTTKYKIIWVTKEKPLGDFPTIDLAVSRLPGSAARQIGERIRLDDITHHLREEVKMLEEKATQLGGDEQNVQKLIIENEILKAQKKILTDTIQSQNFRLKHQAHQPTTDEEIQTKVAAILADLKKANLEVDL